MNELTPSEMLQVHAQIQILETEHRDLDRAIDHLVRTGYEDELGLKRLKKRKLAIKDEVARLKLSLMPDIPA